MMKLFNQIVEKRKDKIKSNIELKSKVEANLKATRSMIRQDELSNSELLELTHLYPKWEVGVEYKSGEFVEHQGKLYKLIQPHTSQADWQPDIAVSLFDEVMPEGVIPEWVQPTGGHDAYNTGDKIIFTDRKVYESTIDANVWSPTGYPQGWKVVV